MSVPYQNSSILLQQEGQLSDCIFTTIPRNCQYKIAWAQKYNCSENPAVEAYRKSGSYTLEAYFEEIVTLYYNKGIQFCI